MQGHQDEVTEDHEPAPVASPPTAEKPIWDIADELFGGHS